jgi:hypothetical protein
MRSMTAPQDITGLAGSNGVEQQVKETSMASFQATLASWREKETAEKGMPAEAVHPHTMSKSCQRPRCGRVASSPPVSANLHGPSQADRLQTS